MLILIFIICFMFKNIYCITLSVVKHVYNFGIIQYIEKLPENIEMSILAQSSFLYTQQKF